MRELFSVADVMAKLKISRPKAMQLLNSGEIRSCKVGRQWRVRSDDLEAYLDSCVVTPPNNVDLTDQSDGE